MTTQWQRGMNHRPARPARTQDAAPAGPRRGGMAGLTQSTHPGAPWTPGVGGSSLPRNEADRATRPDRTATAAGPPGQGRHTQTTALQRPPSCGPHSWPLTHSFQTVGSTLKPGDPTLGPAAGSSAFPTSLLLQGTGRGSGRSGCWNLPATPDSQLDHVPGVATLAGPRS